MRRTCCLVSEGTGFHILIDDALVGPFTWLTNFAVREFLRAKLLQLVFLCGPAARLDFYGF